MQFDLVSEAIDPLIDDKLIEDVCTRSERQGATLYCCSGGTRAKPTWCRQIQAATVPLFQRQRAPGGPHHPGPALGRAAAKRTRHGRQVQATLWTNSEFETLRVLHRAGASVPRPLGRTEGAIATEWIGDADAPAPQLKDVAWIRRRPS